MTRPQGANRKEIALGKSRYTDEERLTRRFDDLFNSLREIGVSSQHAPRRPTVEEAPHVWVVSLPRGVADAVAAVPR